MLSNPLYEVLFCDADDERNCLISLPFAPFPGLELEAAWDSFNWHTVGQVYWEMKTGRFTVYAKREGQTDAESQQCDRAFQIADESMFDLLSSSCIGIPEPGESILPTDEDSNEVELLDLANATILDAVEWLKPRGYVDVVAGPDGNEAILVLRRPD